MLNCGFTQQDISDLRSAEIDWERGRFRRERSKTADHDQVPVVSYPLWTETFVLLRRFRSSDTDYVLLTESGRTWVRDNVKEDGPRGRTDAIRSGYRLVAPGKAPLKMLRMAGATTLNESAKHGRFAGHYPGHAPDVAHARYIHQKGGGARCGGKVVGRTVRPLIA